MSSLNRKSTRRTTARRLLKVASLGLAGLVAGLLSGCSTSNAAARFSGWSSEHTLTASRRIENLDYRRTPEIRHAPSLHHFRSIPIQRMSTTTTAYAVVSEIDAMGHHYEARTSGQ